VINSNNYVKQRHPRRHQKFDQQSSISRKWCEVPCEFFFTNKKSSYAVFPSLPKSVILWPWTA